MTVAQHPTACTVKIGFENAPSFVCGMCMILSQGHLNCRALAKALQRKKANVRRDNHSENCMKRCNIAYKRPGHPKEMKASAINPI